MSTIAHKADGKKKASKLKSVSGGGGGGREADSFTPPKVMLNEALFTDDAVSAQRREFLSGQPFPHLMLRDVFEPGFLRTVRSQLLKADFNTRCNDLFDFHQTDDLKTATHGPVAAFRELIYGPRFRSWMSSVTGIPLNDTIDISSAAYGEGSHLLCHDDDLSERRIAFIAYLIPEDWDATGSGSASGSGDAGAGAGSGSSGAAAGAAWSAAAASPDGGSLDLFDCADSPAEAWGGDPDRVVYDDGLDDDNDDDADDDSRHPAASASAGKGSGAGATASAAHTEDGGVGGRCILPRRVVTRLVPRFNSLAFFATSALSHHQVAEVLRAGSKLGGGAGSEPRLSISGWFHGPPVRRPPMPRMPRPAFALPLPALADGDGAAAEAAGSAAPAVKRARKDDASAEHDAAAVSAAVLPASLHSPLLLPAPPLAAWLTPLYLRPGTQRAARARFEEDASLNLTQLLADAPLKRVMRDLGRQCWRVAGPPNMRSYRVAAGASFPSAPVLAGSQALPSFAAGAGAGASSSTSTAGGVGGGSSGSSGGASYGYLPDSLFHLVRALCSTEFAAFLSAVTGLRLLPAPGVAAVAASASSGSAGAADGAVGKKQKKKDAAAAAIAAAASALPASAAGKACPGVSCEVRCFGHGDYTLLYDPQHREEAKAAKRRNIAATASEGASAGAAAGAPAASSSSISGAGGAGSVKSTAASKAAASSGAAGGAAVAAAAGGAAGSLWPAWLTSRCFDAPSSASVLEATLCLTDPAHDEEWADDEKSGGFVSYLTANEELLRIQPQANSLSLVLREGGPDGSPPQLMSFVKYVKAGAPGPRYDVALQFLVLP